MLALLVGVRRALYRIRENKIEPHARLIEDWKRAFIRDCLYGVDIKPEAIEIARLRLWLSLVVDADPFDMEPLPNLDYKLMAGDSLIETFDGVEIYPTRPRQASASAAQEALLTDSAAPALIRKLHEQQAAYFQPDGAGSREELKREIQQTEYDIVQETLRVRRENEMTNLQRVVQKLANLNVQGKAEPRDLLAERQRIEHSIAMTNAALGDLKAGKPLPFFLYRLHFASVFAEKGGFDIVIANPPYVSILNMRSNYKEQLKQAYPEVAAGRADLYVYFYARGLELLHGGGALTFVSSDKFLKAKYGEGLLKLLATASDVQFIIDFGDFPVFDAAAYPCLVQVTKGVPTKAHTYRALVAGRSIQLDKLGETLDAQGQDLPQSEGVRTPTGNPDTTALAKKLLPMGEHLGHYIHDQMFRGIVPGRPAFVIDDDTRKRLIAQDFNSAEIIKPFLHGRDIGRGDVLDFL